MIDQLLKKNKKVHYAYLFIQTIWSHFILRYNFRQ